ncbi:hypothetical protein [Alteribacter populi]|uniref:hypothetical protein n=1 Tax=Alteribacter populi TaxID=2011011 RepID=UPI000BBB1827|nr:hypothetical protein [Alteribacter populi]
MKRDLTLQQIAEDIPKSVLNASDKDLQGFQKILDQTLEIREAHKDLHKMVQSYSSSNTNPNSGVQRSS